MYKVTLPREFPYEQRIRAGIVVNKEHGFEGELTADQVKTIKADSVLTITEVKEAAPKAQTKDTKSK